MALDVVTRPSFATGAPKLRLKTAFFTRDGALDYDVTPDGQRFRMIEPIRDIPLSSISSSAGSTSYGG